MSATVLFSHSVASLPLLRSEHAPGIMGQQQAPIGGTMKKQFVAPVLRDEATLAHLTLTNCVSGQVCR
jgi:hypothetical protein